MTDDALVEAIKLVSAGLDLEETLSKLVSSARDLTGAQYGALGVLDEQGRLTQFIHQGMSKRVVKKIGRPPRPVGLLGMVMTQDALVRVDDLQKHEAFGGFPKHHPDMHSFLGVPVHLGEHVFGNLYVADMISNAFTGRHERELETLASAAAIAISNAQLFEQTQARERRQEAVASVNALVLARAELTQVLDVVADQARRLSDAVVAVVALPDELGDLTTRAISVEDGADGKANRRAKSMQGVPLDELGRIDADAITAWVGAVATPDSVIQHAYATGQPQEADAAQIDPQAYGSPRVLFGPALAVPLRTPDITLGVIVVIRPTGAAQFRADEKNFVMAFAAQTTVTLILAQTQEERETLALFQERDRIARDLHDGVIQRLYAIGMSLQTVAHTCPADSPMAAKVEAAIDGLDTTIKEVRHTIFGLGSRDQAPARLTELVRQECEAATEALGFTPHVSFLGPVDNVAEIVNEQMLLCLREALANAAKHSQASEVHVSVRCQHGRVALVVIDDGIGIPAKVTRRSGLANLRERAERLGGTLVLGGAPGNGTQVHWSVPVPG